MPVIIIKKYENVKNYSKNLDSVNVIDKYHLDYVIKFRFSEVTFTKLKMHWYQRQSDISSYRTTKAIKFKDI